MKEIKITNRNFKALVDDCDLELISQFKWRFSAGFIVTTNLINGKRISMHHLIMGRSKLQIDHINRKPWDNRRNNLRFATPVQNCANRGPINGRKFKGVSKCKKTGKFKTAIRTGSKGWHLGYFEDEQEAAFAYNIASEHLFGEFSYQNNVDITPLKQEIIIEKIKNILKRS